MVGARSTWISSAVSWLSSAQATGFVWRAIDGGPRGLVCDAPRGDGVFSCPIATPDVAGALAVRPHSKERARARAKATKVAFEIAAEPF